MNGVVDLWEDFDQAPPTEGQIGSSSPPMIIGDVVVVGAAMQAGGAPNKENVAGHVRGYDVRTGERIWIFHTVPKLGEFGHDTWLEEAEAAFRALKSALAIRPLFHQLERRVKAHLLVAFLGYALWVTLKHLLHRRGTLPDAGTRAGAPRDPTECRYRPPDDRRPTAARCGSGGSRSLHRSSSGSSIRSRSAPSLPRMERGM